MELDWVVLALELVKLDSVEISVLLTSSTASVPYLSWLGTKCRCFLCTLSPSCSIELQGILLKIRSKYSLKKCQNRTLIKSMTYTLFALFLKNILRYK